MQLVGWKGNVDKHMFVANSRLDGSENYQKIEVPSMHGSNTWYRRRSISFSGRQITIIFNTQIAARFPNVGFKAEYWIEKGLTYILTLPYLLDYRPGHLFI